MNSEPTIPPFAETRPRSVPTPHRLEGFVKADMPPGQKERCIFENDQLLVSHSFNKFPNGTVDAVMTVQTIRDGKVCRMETGSTPVPQDSPNFY